MKDSAHDKEHIYRVLYYAMEIAKEEKEVDYDILVCACLLHDIGRKEQFENPKLCHAMEGAKKAYAFLSKSGFEETFVARVKMCIETHFYTKRGEELAKERKRAAVNFYENLLREIQVAYGEGKKELEERLKR